VAADATLSGKSPLFPTVAMASRQAAPFNGYPHRCAPTGDVPLPMTRSTWRDAAS